MLAIDGLFVGLFSFLFSDSSIRLLLEMVARIFQCAFDHVANLVCAGTYTHTRTNSIECSHLHQIIQSVLELFSSFSVLSNAKNKFPVTAPVKTHQSRHSSAHIIAPFDGTYINTCAWFAVSTMDVIRTFVVSQIGTAVCGCGVTCNEI